MARAQFFGEVENFLDFVRPLCSSGVDRACFAVETAKANKQLLDVLLCKYVERARPIIRDESVTLTQELIDAFIPEPSPKLVMCRVTADTSIRALRMIRRIDVLVDELAR
jgi:hypothetical protein